MRSENDFEAEFVNGVCTLRGHLIDSTELEFSKEIFENSKEINLGGLKSYSWIGLQHFYEYICKLNKSVQLSEIPQSVYRILLLFPGFGKNIKIKNFQLEVYNTVNEIKKISISLEQLAEIGKSQGCFAKLSEGNRIRGSIHHLCRPYFQDSSLPKKNYASNWCQQNQELCSFMYEYACFTWVILETCSLAQNSTFRFIEDSLQNICLRVSNLEFCIKSIEPNYSDYKFRYFMLILMRIREISNFVVVKINLSSSTFEAVVKTFEALYMNERTIASNVFEQIEFFIHFADQLLPIVKNLEDVGAELGENTLKYGDYENLKKVFDNFNSSDLTEKNIISIRKKLKLDYQVNLTWNETKNEIDLEFKEIQNTLNKCVIMLQSFDLVRQILEHRIMEIEILKNYLNPLKNNDIEFEKIKEKILNQMSSQLVTFQEKLSYNFFFVNSNMQPNEINSTDGNLLLF